MVQARQAAPHLYFNARHMRKILFTLDGTIIGYAKISFPSNDDKVYLDTLVINAPYRHRGWGQACLRYLLNRYKSLGAIVGIDNAAAMTIFLKAGFRFVVGPYYESTREEISYYMEKNN